MLFKEIHSSLIALSSFLIDYTSLDKFEQVSCCSFHLICPDCEAVVNHIHSHKYLESLLSHKVCNFSIGKF